jgi:uncharacterized membrane protein YpjA
MRHRVRSFPGSGWLYPLLLVGNISGTLYGFYWYAGQFAVTPLFLWLFVPNSPLAVLYFTLSLLFLRRGCRSPLLEGLAYFGLIKHGSWTSIIIILYWLAGSSRPDNLWLLAGHGVMVLQAILAWHYFGLPLTTRQAVAVSAWYLFDDYLDYVIGIHPWIDQSLVSITVVRTVALTLSVSLTAAYLLASHRKETLRH